MSIEYTDHVSLATTREVILEQHGLQGILSVRVREFPKKDKYAFYMHVGRTLIETFSGPLEEIHKAHDRANAVRQQVGEDITWEQDG